MSRYNYMVFIESRYFSGFFIISVQFLVSSRGQDIVPITEMDKNFVRLAIESLHSEERTCESV